MENEATGVRSAEQVQADANRLWQLLADTIKYYNTVACPCAFPRFFQYTTIDCVDTGSSFYMSETEGFIQAATEYYEVQKLDQGPEAANSIFTCKVCSSTFNWGWSDFSIHVNRSFLKPITLKATQKGADPEFPTPYFVGPFGHALPDRSAYKWVDFDTFKSYIQSLKNA